MSGILRNGFFLYFSTGSHFWILDFGFWILGFENLVDFRLLFCGIFSYRDCLIDFVFYLCYAGSEMSSMHKYSPVGYFKDGIMKWVCCLFSTGSPFWILDFMV